MTLGIQAGDGAQALDLNQLFAARDGFSVLTSIGGACKVGKSGNSTLAVDSGEVLFDGEVVAVDTQTVAVPDNTASNPRKDVVFIDGDGSAQLSQGTPAPAKPAGETGRDTFQPAPNDFADIDAVVLAEVFVPAGATAVDAANISDRRVPSELAQGIDLPDDTAIGFGDNDDAEIRFDDSLGAWVVSFGDEEFQVLPDGTLRLDGQLETAGDADIGGDISFNGTFSPSDINADSVVSDVVDADVELSLPVFSDNSNAVAEDSQVWFNDGSGPGSRSLEISPSSAGVSRVSRPPANTPQLGDSFIAKVRATSPGDSMALAILTADPQVRHSNGTGVRLFVRAEEDKIAIAQFVSGNVAGFDDTDTAVPTGETLTVKSTLGIDREISMTLLDSTETELATVTTTLDSRIPKSGAVQYEAQNFSTPPTQYFDGPFITRRLGEETRERQRGSTETSKLQTRGGVGAGPRILPQNRAAEIMADAGITSALAAGTEVSYGLQLNGRKMLTIFGEADGSGGLQNPAVDFESRQLKDVSNNQTADSMTANPEADTEDGFIEVELGGTAYQIPVYQA